MDIAVDIDRFADRYIAVWNEADPAERRREIVALWHPEGTQSTGSQRHRGHDALEARIGSAHDELVRDGGFVFRTGPDVTGHHDTLTFTAHMLPADGGDIAWAGRVVLTLDRDGLITHDYQFDVDAPTLSADRTRAAVAEFLRRLGDGDPDRLAELFDERVEWQLNWPDGDHPSTPWIRPRRTRADVADHFRELARFHVPAESAATVSEVLVDGSDAVVIGDIRQTVEATGAPYAARCALHLTVEDDLITRYGVYEDSLTVFRAHADPAIHGQSL